MHIACRLPILKDKKIYWLQIEENMIDMFHWQKTLGRQGISAKTSPSKLDQEAIYLGKISQNYQLCTKYVTPKQTTQSFGRTSAKLAYYAPTQSIFLEMTHGQKYHY